MDDPPRIEGRPLVHFKACGFAGALHPVNPSCAMLQDAPAFMAELPEKAEAAIVSVPGEAAGA
nr:hypothetical protein [Roseomonas sp. SXEYE001]